MTDANDDALTWLDAGSVSASVPEQVRKRGLATSSISLAVAALALLVAIGQGERGESPADASVQILPGMVCHDGTFLAGWDDSGSPTCREPVMPSPEPEIPSPEPVGTMAITHCESLTDGMLDPMPCVAELIVQAEN